MLKAVRVSNFRAIRELDMDDLGQTNVLIGRAGSGKSSVLEALAVAAYVLYGSEQPISRGAVDMLRYVAARHGASSFSYGPGLSVEFTTVPVIAMPITSLPQLSVGFTTVPAKRLSFNYIGSFSVSLTGVDARYAKIDVALHGNECRVERCRVEVDGDAQELGASPASNYVSKLKNMAISSLANLVFLDDMFMRCVFDLPGPWEKFFTEGYDEMACEMLTDVLGVEVRGIKIIPRKETRFDILMDVSSGWGVQRLFLGDMAEGAKRLLSVMLAAAHVGKGGTLLVEEPETHLHPLGVSSLADLMADASKDFEQQSFISTHSLETVDAISKACDERGLGCRIIFLHRKPDGLVEARVLRSNRYRELREMGLDLRMVPEIL